MGGLSCAFAVIRGTRPPPDKKAMCRMEYVCPAYLNRCFLRNLPTFADFCHSYPPFSSRPDILQTRRLLIWRQSAPIPFWQIGNSGFYHPRARHKPATDHRKARTLPFAARPPKSKSPKSIRASRTRHLCHVGQDEGFKHRGSGAAKSGEWGRGPTRRSRLC